MPICARRIPVLLAVLLLAGALAPLPATHVAAALSDVDESP
jgi:hypothetical protein